MKTQQLLLVGICSVPLALALGCTDDGGATDEIGETGDGDGDSTGDGDGDPTGDGDGDPTAGGMCGDGVIEGDEQCEGDDLAGGTCESLGYTGGELACGDDCMFDASGCTDAVCGDGMIGGAETCDGVEFGEATCESLGYTGGELACLDDCTIDESGCSNDVCGDDMVGALEDCDGALLNDETCESQGFYAGELSCSGECAFDTSACTNCGNGVIDDGEVCDGADVGGETCEGLGYLGGTLGCSDSCDAIVEDNCTNDWWGDDFEAGAALGAEWVLSGNANWFGSTSTAHGGSFAAENGDIGNNQSSTMEVTLDFVQDGDVTFWYRVGSEANYDYLRFYIDGVEQDAWSGVINWTMQTYAITTGSHTLRWSYTKDGSVSSNGDTVWIDDITTVGGVLP